MKSIYPMHLNYKATGVAILMSQKTNSGELLSDIKCHFIVVKFHHKDISALKKG